MAHLHFELAIEAAAEQGQAHKPQPITLLMPAEVIEQLGLLFSSRWLDFSFEIAPNLLAEPLNTVVVEQIFHAGMTSHFAVAMVTL